jgi:hypothetical protein
VRAVRDAAAGVLVLQPRRVVEEGAGAGAAAENMAASRTVSFSTNLSTSAQASPSPICESASTMK